MSVLKFPAPKNNARKLKALPLKPFDVVLISKMGKRRVNQTVIVGEVRKYKDGTFAFYYKGADNYNLRVWSKVAKFHRIGGAKVNGVGSNMLNSSNG